MARIGKSVGRGGVNRLGDVVTVHYLINGSAHLIDEVAPVSVKSRVDDALVAAIDAFQRTVVGMDPPDGRVDPGGRTLEALNRTATSGRWVYYPAGPQEPLATIARRYVGATEHQNNRMGTDPRMREIFEADYARMSPGTTDGYAWCSSFVSLCTQRLIASDPVYVSVRPPREASVQRFRTLWAPTQRCLVFPPDDPAHTPHRGDVLVFKFSHIGVVERVDGKGVFTIEGNTSAAGSREGTTVRRQFRRFGRIRCFIRLPVPLDYDLVCSV